MHTSPWRLEKAKIAPTKTLERMKLKANRPILQIQKSKLNFRETKRQQLQLKIDIKW